MGRLGGNKKTSQQTTALYELYKNRTYDCTLKTFGNVMLQPTMYFVVRHMPMFNGTYIIRNVKHSISPGAFNTEVRGQRLSALSNLSITSELAAVNQDFNKKLSDKVKTLTSNNSIVTLNSASNQYLTGQQSKDYQISGRTPYQGFISTAVDSKEQTCQVNLWGAQNEPISSQATLTGLPYSEQVITYDDLISVLRENVTDVNMRLYLYSLFFLSGYNPEQPKFKIKLNNLFGATGDIRWTSILGVAGYRCLLTNQSSPIPFFGYNKLSDCLGFTETYFKEILKSYLSDTTNIFCLGKTGYNILNINETVSRECTTNLFIKLFYDKWYTAGNSTEQYDKDDRYSEWFSNITFALQKAYENGILN